MMDAIRKALRGKSYLYGTLAYLPYDIEEMKQKLDPSEEIDWENFSDKYDIDHRIPASWFEFEDFDDPEFTLCFSLDNLWLMESSNNRGKRDRFADPSESQLKNPKFVKILERNKLYKQ